MTHWIVFSSDLDDPVAWRDEIKSRRDDVELVDWRDATAPERFEFALLWKPPPTGLTPYTRLRGIQSLGAGINQLDLGALPRGIPIARLIDPSLTATMVDYSVAAVYRHFRGFDAYEADKHQHRWQYVSPRPKRSFTVGVMGLGQLGGAIAATLATLGFPVRGWSRSARPMPGVESFSGPDGLEAFLAGTHCLICVLPLTAETRGILNAKTLRMLPQGAYLVNIGRGAHLVEADLPPLVTSGQIRGATLDVFAEEPLPAEHPFWRLPGVLITPHVAGAIDPASAAAVVLENLDRALAGKPLRNGVDLVRGY